MEKVRIALIGAGHLARNQHLPNLMRLDGVELAAVCDFAPGIPEIMKRDLLRTVRC